LDKIIEQDCMEYLDKIDLTPLKDKTVYITGANGLIGTYFVYLFHLANITQNMGIKIVAISRNPPCGKLRDIFKDRYDFYSVDLAAAEALDLPCKADYIIHGATYAQPGKFLQNYSETIHLNTTATENLLQKAKKDGAKFLYLSSSEVYGNPDEKNIPTSEDYPGLCSPVSVRSVYSESKRMGETLCFAYKNFEAVEVKVARVAMSYGPGVSIHDERVMGQFMNQALSGKKIVMLDDGYKERTFCYVADCVLLLLNVLLYGRDFVYNVGGGERITIRKLAEEICALTGSTLSVGVSVERPAQNVEVSPKLIELDISKISKEFDLPPFKPFREGLKRTIEWNQLRIQ
jgi:UDP-glucuronate decarboxylase